MVKTTRCGQETRPVQGGDVMITCKQCGKSFVWDGNKVCPECREKNKKHIAEKVLSKREATS